MIRVQEQDFDINQEYQALLNNDSSSGAVVLFVGRVRDLNQGHQVSQLFLEHYSQMTEKYLAQLEQQAMELWPLENVSIIHRVGELKLEDKIVLVAVSSTHRESAFEAAQYLIDLLKANAPFWKKELVDGGKNRWVNANHKDKIAAAQWS
ncbi:molybdenum cofactor biosynthesis protein MoaE [Pseudoalteromonas sp. T1lg23B]|uniref:molybdenum cofactor biosynthesis protein MoaE n=1 Tax=Pseudoalteromonas sp. T1lg23B TaxID=2077097 RepID=UPI000CF6F202|nr:molybdenum cofactor biosynthesis protein MoaE [Pseudoalteromonas sp. T1lg23B]